MEPEHKKDATKFTKIIADKMTSNQDCWQDGIKDDKHTQSIGNMESKPRAAMSERSP